MRLFQLHFALSDAPFWTEEHAGVDYRELYNFIVDYLEVSEGQEAKLRVKNLLAWWNRYAWPVYFFSESCWYGYRQIFPEAVKNTKSTANTSRNIMKSQQAARTAQGERQ